MVAHRRTNVGRDILVTIQAQAGLQPTLEGHVALHALFLKIRMTLNERSRHNELGDRQRMCCFAHAHSKQHATIERA